jgi:hypothetical protein
MESAEGQESRRKDCLKIKDVRDDLFFRRHYERRADKRGKV